MIKSWLRLALALQDKTGIKSALKQVFDPSEALAYLQPNSPYLKLFPFPIEGEDDKTIELILEKIDFIENRRQQKLLAKDLGAKLPDLDYTSLDSITKDIHMIILLLEQAPTKTEKPESPKPKDYSMIFKHAIFLDIEDKISHGR